MFATMDGEGDKEA